MLQNEYLIYATMLPFFYISIALIFHLHGLKQYNILKLNISCLT
jgi:hypothetical protein